MKPSIVSCNRARLFIREYDNPYVTELHRNPILRTGDTRLDEPSSRRLCMGVDDSPFLFVEIGEIVLIQLGHFLDETRIHGETLEQICVTEFFKGYSHFLDIANNALRLMVSHVVDRPTKAVQDELSSDTNTQKPVPSRVRLRLRETYLGKAGQGGGVLDPCPFIPYNFLDGLGHPKTMCEDIGQSIDVSASVGRRQFVHCNILPGPMNEEIGAHSSPPLLRLNVAVHPAEGRRGAPLPRIGCNGWLCGSFETPAVGVTGQQFVM